MMGGKAAIIVIVLSMAIASAGCGSMVRSAAAPMMDNLIASVMKQRDPEVVREGAPAYLLLIDGLVEGAPDDPELLAAAAQLYSAYLSAFIIDKNPERAVLMGEKARDYAFRAVSLKNKIFAQACDKPFAQFTEVPGSFKKGDEKTLFLVISTWAAFIQTHASNWDNLADIAKIEALTKRLLELDETYYYGAGHLAMGTLLTLLPKEFGGKPEEARTHFEKALQISGGKFFPVQVTYATRYARMTFDRKLHDSLLKQVMDAPADSVPELTLINTLAKQQAAQLLADAEDYFGSGE